MADRLCYSCNDEGITKEQIFEMFGRTKWMIEQAEEISNMAWRKVNINEWQI